MSELKQRYFIFNSAIQARVQKEGKDHIFDSRLDADTHIDRMVGLGFRRAMLTSLPLFPLVAPGTLPDSAKLEIVCNALIAWKKLGGARGMTASADCSLVTHGEIDTLLASVLKDYKVEFKHGQKVIRSIDASLVNAHEHTGTVDYLVGDEYKVIFEGNRVAYFKHYELRPWPGN